MAIGVICFIIPFAAYKFFTNKLVGYLASSLLGSVLLLGNMLYLESKAFDSDMDLIFLLVLLFWLLMTFIYNAVVFSLISAFINRKRPK